ALPTRPNIANKETSQTKQTRFSRQPLGNSPLPLVRGRPGGGDSETASAQVDPANDTKRTYEWTLRRPAFPTLPNIPNKSNIPHIPNKPNIPNKSNILYPSLSVLTHGTRTWLEPDPTSAQARL